MKIYLSAAFAGSKELISSCLIAGQHPRPRTLPLVGCVSSLSRLASHCSLDIILLGYYRRPRLGCSRTAPFLNSLNALLHVRFSDFYHRLTEPEA